MSWNGTVRCGYCYGKGHNRRGCPELQNVMVARLHKNGDDVYAKHYFEKKKEAKVRRCTYCNLKGHNRATCEELKREVHKWQTTNAAFRRSLVEELLQAGVGVGALIKVNDDMWRLKTKQGLVMVKGINPDASIQQPYQCLAIRGILDPRQTALINLSTELYLKLSYGRDRFWYGSDLEVVSPTKHCLLRTIPNYDEWLKGGTLKWIKKEIFASEKAESFYKNKYVV